MSLCSEYAGRLAKNDGAAMAVVKEMIRRVRGGAAQDFDEIVRAANGASRVAAAGGRGGRGFPSIMSESKKTRKEGRPKLRRCVGRPGAKWAQ